MIWTLALPALAAEVTDEEILAAVSERYGKQVPAAALCTARPTELPPRFGEVVVAGVTRGHQGCTSMGLMVEGALVPLPEAAPAVIDTEAWAELDPAQRAADLRDWTAHVILAFDQPEALVFSTGSGGKTTVEGTYLHRGETRGMAIRSEGSWTFGPQGNVLRREDTKRNVYVTRMATRPGRLQGLSQETVVAALSTQGRVIRGCFEDAWAEDLTLSGGIHLAWQVTEQKSGRVALIDDPEQPASQALAQCYSNAIARLEYPEGANGAVQWVFAVQRQPLREAVGTP